jgi:hypothetical protein
VLKEIEKMPMRQIDSSEEEDFEEPIYEEEFDQNEEREIEKEIFAVFEQFDQAYNVEEEKPQVLVSKKAYNIEEEKP